MADPPQATEYTLQGVMRFLQIEWHNHERARNAWDIERAEMKAKIAKQEGENRSSKKMNEGLDRQVKMLEKVLRKERAKNNATLDGEKFPIEEEVRREWNGSKFNAKRAQSAEFDMSGTRRKEQDAQRESARLFCQKNLEEITYLTTPSSLPLAPQMESQQIPNVQYQHDQHSTAEEAYMQQQQQMQQHNQQRRSHPTSLSHLPSLPNHQPPPPRQTPEFYSVSHLPPQEASTVSRQAIPTQQYPPNQSLQSPSERPPRLPNNVPDDEVESVSHSYDAFGRPVQLVENQTEISHSTIQDDPDGWDFDDASTVVEVQPDLHPARMMDTDLFPSANNLPSKSPPRTSPSQRRRSSGSMGMLRRRSDGPHEVRDHLANTDPPPFKVRFALRGHLDVVRSIIFTGGGSPSEPEVCTTGDDGTLKRWIIPSSYGNFAPGQPQQNASTSDLDIQSYFTHRGHEGVVTCLAASPASASFSTGGRAPGDGWVFSGGQDSTVRVWERGRVDPKATLDGHTDAVWALCVLCPTSAAIFGTQNPNIPGDRIIIASGSADRTVKIWAVSSPPQLSSPQNAPGATSRRGVGGSRRHSITSGSGFPSSPQPSTASGTPFYYTLVHSIEMPDRASPTCIAPMGPSGENFVVGFADSSVLIFDTRTGEEVVGMASSETYDGTPATGINSIVVTSNGAGENRTGDGVAPGIEAEEEGVVHGATGNAKGGGIEGVVISGHEDRFVRFFDANSGQCTYSMLAHPASIASLSLSPDGRELVSAGHDASLRFWSLERRSCVQEVGAFRVMRGEGVVCVVWSQDGRWVVAGGGDGGVKVFGR